MRTGLIGFANQLVRGWSSLYTRGLPCDHRDRRRAELESDLWEHVFASREQHEGQLLLTLQILTRLIAGVPADLTWRLEHRASGKSTARRRITHRRDRHMDAAGSNRRTRFIVVSFVAVITALLIIALIFVGGGATFIGITLAAFIGVGFAANRRRSGGYKARIPHPEPAHLPARRYRLRLVSVVVTTVIIMIAVGMYALSLEEWGQTGSILFNGVFVLGLVTTIGALVLLVVDVARPEAET